MSYSDARNIIIQRIKNELIGPNSDIFFTDNDSEREIIEGKPLTRYFSGILFPIKKITSLDEAGENDVTDEDQDSIPENENLNSFDDNDSENNEDYTILEKN